MNEVHVHVLNCIFLHVLCHGLWNISAHAKKIHGMKFCHFVSEPMLVDSMYDLKCCEYD